MDKPISQRVRELRGTITLKEFCKPLGVTPMAVNNVENGVSELSMSLAVKISEHYNVSLDWLVKGIGEIAPEKSTSVKYDTEWKDKYLQVLEENQVLYKKLLKESEQEKQDLKAL